MAACGGSRVPRREGGGGRRAVTEGFAVSQFGGSGADDGVDLFNWEAAEDTEAAEDRTGNTTVVVFAAPNEVDAGRFLAVVGRDGADADFVSVEPVASYLAGCERRIVINFATHAGAKRLMSSLRHHTPNDTLVYCRGCPCSIAWSPERMQGREAQIRVAARRGFPLVRGPLHEWKALEPDDPLPPMAMGATVVVDGLPLSYTNGKLAHWLAGAWGANFAKLSRHGADEASWACASSAIIGFDNRTSAMSFSLEERQRQPSECHQCALTKQVCNVSVTQHSVLRAAMERIDRAEEPARIRDVRGNWVVLPVEASEWT